MGSLSVMSAENSVCNGKWALVETVYTTPTYFMLQRGKTWIKNVNGCLCLHRQDENTLYTPVMARLAFGVLAFRPSYTNTKVKIHFSP